MESRAKGAKYIFAAEAIFPKFKMAGKIADGSMFCQADGLSQSSADRASVPLADSRQNKAHDAGKGHVTNESRFRKNTVAELRKKRLKRNTTRRQKIRQMTKKEKRARIRSKLAKDLEDVHIQHIKKLKISEIDAKRKGHILLEKVETNTESITVAQWLLQVILCKKKNKARRHTVFFCFPLF